MAIFVKDAELNALRAKANNYDAIVNALVKNNEGLTPEEVTSELIVNALTSENEDVVNLTSRLETATNRVSELEAENKELRRLPGGTPAPISSSGEPKGEVEDLASFADKNAGDTVAILNRCVEEGII